MVRQCFGEKLPLASKMANMVMAKIILLWGTLHSAGLPNITEFQNFKMNKKTKQHQKIPSSRSLPRNSRRLSVTCSRLGVCPGMTLSSSPRECWECSFDSSPDVEGFSSFCPFLVSSERREVMLKCFPMFLKWLSSGI